MNTPTNEEQHPSEAPTPEVEPAAEALEASPGSLQQRLAEAEKQVLLAQADLENFRKRTRRETQEQIKYACLELMSELLDSLDNLQRAVESYQSEPNGDGLAEGVRMVSEQIGKTLENHGCHRINAEGQAFDPNLHQALQMQASPDHPANTVMLDLRSGFRLHDRVIRPSQVFVSTGPPADSSN